MKRKTINLFFRKPVYGISYSVENFYRELIKNHKRKDLIFKIKVCPLESKGFFNRVVLIFWALYNQADVNHICGDINFISILLNKRKTINTILDFYSLKRLSGIKKIIYNLFWIKIPIFKSSQIIAISNKTKKEILKNTNTNTNKISVIDICAQGMFKKKTKHTIRKKTRILIVGTGKNKNLRNIFFSLKNVNCELAIIGILSNEHIFFLKELKIDYINFVALAKKEILRQYINCDMLVYASTYEGFGVPILEAQSIGRSVITSKLEPMTYVGGKGALYVNPNNIKSIRNGIIKIITNNKFRNKLIEKGFENIKRFNKKKIFNNYLNCYNNILRKKSLL
tara:strand:- start:127 stop:1143 length:1017 start_codon:yes stop_codon:yes gene_type:complete